MAHPFVDLLRDARIARLWTGLAFSAMGSNLGSMALIWLAIGASGSDAALLLTVGNATVLAVSLLSGAFIDRYPARATMIASDFAAAAFALLPVTAALFLPVGLPIGLPVLLTTAIGLAACSALFQPALLSTVPVLAGGRVQALNGLLDATARLSRLGGPFVAGLLSLVLPTLHLLTVNALSFLASAAAVASLGRDVGGQRTPQPEGSAMQRLLAGWNAARADRDVRRVLAANTLILFAWGPAVTLGLPLLVAESGGSLSSVALLVGAYGAGDFLSNVLVAAHKPRRPGRFMFAGYVLLGAALTAVPLLDWALPDPLRWPAMMLASFLSATGGPMFFLPMMTCLQTRIDRPRVAGVIRLRLALVAAAIMAGSALSPLLFDSLGVGLAIAAYGGFIALVGLAGTILCADLEPLS